VHMLAFCQVNVLNEYDNDDDATELLIKFDLIHNVEFRRCL